MTKTAGLALMSILTLATGTTAVAQDAQPGMKLVWSDEFSTDGAPDRAKWAYDTSRNEDGWYNDEAQYYSANRLENARVENGHLIIEARRESLEGQVADWGGQQYTSARLITQGKQDWTYGLYEIRAKLACGRGSWPAIWMLPTAGDWPRGGELDIMEHVGHQEGIVHATVHTGATNHASGTGLGGQITLTDACTTFHTYQLLWEPDGLFFGVDDKGFNTVMNDGRGDRMTWPFDKPFYMILNVAVGGTWGGAEGVDDAIFPARMEVDYVRVFQAE